jgi:DNA-binding CsgD family transcriptional regulator
MGQCGLCGSASVVQSYIINLKGTRCRPSRCHKSERGSRMEDIHNERTYRSTCPPCGEVLVGKSEEEVLNLASEHARKFHGVELLSVFPVTEIRAIIRSESELHWRIVEHLEETGYLPPQRASLLETKLSHREQEIVQYIIHSFSNAEIAKCLCISVRTVNTHLVNIYEKLDVHSKAGLVALVRASDRILEAGTRSGSISRLEPFLLPTSSMKNSPHSD